MTIPGDEATHGLTALVVSGGGFQGLTLIKGLRQHPDIRIVMADIHEENVSKHFVDVFERVPPLAEREAFVDALMAICRRHGVRVIFASTDFELELLADLRADLASVGAVVAVSDVAFTRAVRNKGSLHGYCVERGLPTLPLLDISAPAQLTFPIFGKPVQGWGSRGLRVVRSAAELATDDLAALARDYVWQPHLASFQEYSADFAVGFDGRPTRVVVRERVRTSGGFCVIADEARLPEVSAVAERFAAAAASDGARGLINIQILHTSNGIWVSDVNPRVGTSAVFTNGVGVNLPVLVCASAEPTLAPLPPTRRQGPVRMVRYLEELWIERRPPVEVSALIFDLDDTLLDQKRWIADKLVMVHEAFAARLPPRREFLGVALRILEEGNRAHLFDAIASELKLDPDQCRDMIAHYRAAEPASAPLYPDVRATLAELRRRGFRLGVLTDNPPDSQRQKLRVAGLEAAFDAIVFCRESGGEKPGAPAFAAAAERLGLPVGRLAMVGDNLYRDILGAERAGYAASFWLPRAGSFFNFSGELFSLTREPGSGVERIEGLGELLRRVSLAV